MSDKLKEMRDNIIKDSNNNNYSQNQNKINIFCLDDIAINQPTIYRNPSVPFLYKKALANEKNTNVSNTGALMVYSNEKTGRSPNNKRIVKDETTVNTINWNEINIPTTEKYFNETEKLATDFLNNQKEIYVIDQFASCDKNHRVSIRIICSRPYHAIFSTNMFINPTSEELDEFIPEYTIINAGELIIKDNKNETKTDIILSFKKKHIVIVGTEYAGEIKKSVFTIFNYIMPQAGILPMHCSTTEDEYGSGSILFGLSGTGKTTLSTTHGRSIIGDDEHCWDNEGVFNIEGGCYPKTINLCSKKEHAIYKAITFGSILENVKYNPETHKVNYYDTSITQNTRASFPLKLLKNTKAGGRTSHHPKNVIFLTCDAFGVLPPVSKLSIDQIAYYFILGYTSKVPGTEINITEPIPTFSPCFGAAFLPLSPEIYTKILVEKIKLHGSNCWLVNTGWIKGEYGIGSRIDLDSTRKIIINIYENLFDSTKFEKDSIFNLSIPKECKDINSNILNPINLWDDKDLYIKKATKLKSLFSNHFSNIKTDYQNIYI